MKTSKCTCGNEPIMAEVDQNTFTMFHSVFCDACGKCASGETEDHAVIMWNQMIKRENEFDGDF